MKNEARSGRQQYGCFLIIPLKYDPDTFDRGRLEKVAPCVPLRTMDLNENVKAMFDRGNEAAIGSCHVLPWAALAAPLDGDSGEMGALACTVSDGTGSYDFVFSDSWLYVFHTRVAFLCLSLSFSRMETLKAICNPGSASSSATFFRVDAAGEGHPLDVEGWLADFLEPLGLRKFFDGPSSFLLDTYAYIFAVVPERFSGLEEMRRLTFNLHKMMPLDTPMEDDSEDDIRYVYAVKHQDFGTYRWGCCVSSQTTSYIVADAEMDFAAQRDAQAEDGLPVTLLALYEKYTCLRFTELITRLKKRQIRELKKLMLDFQAYGTVTPANLSRWHNVKQIYAHLLEVNDIKAAIEDIQRKLEVLASHQEQMEQNQRDTVIGIVTVFGIVSILASVLTIVQTLSHGSPLVWTTTVLTAVMLVLITLVALWRR